MKGRLDERRADQLRSALNEKTAEINLRASKEQADIRVNGTAVRVQTLNQAASKKAEVNGAPAKGSKRVHIDEQGRKRYADDHPLIPLIGLTGEHANRHLDANPDLNFDDFDLALDGENAKGRTREDVLNSAKWKAATKHREREKAKLYEEFGKPEHQLPAGENLHADWQSEWLALSVEDEERLKSDFPDIVRRYTVCEAFRDFTEGTPSSLQIMVAVFESGH